MQKYWYVSCQSSLPGNFIQGFPEENLTNGSCKGQRSLYTSMQFGPWIMILVRRVGCTLSRALDIKMSGITFLNSPWKQKLWFILWTCWEGGSTVSSGPLLEPPHRGWKEIMVEIFVKLSFFQDLHCFQTWHHFMFLLAKPVVECLEYKLHRLEVSKKMRKYYNIFASISSIF